MRRPAQIESHQPWCRVRGEVRGARRGAGRASERFRPQVQVRCRRSRGGHGRGRGWYHLCDQHQHQHQYRSCTSCFVLRVPRCLLAKRMWTCEPADLRTCEPAKRQLTTDEADRQAGTRGRTPLASQRAWGSWVLDLVLLARCIQYCTLEPWHLCAPAGRWSRPALRTDDRGLSSSRACTVYVYSARLGFDRV